MADAATTENPPVADAAKASKGGKLLPLLMILNLAGTGAVVFLQLKPRPVHVAPTAEEEQKKKEEEHVKKPGPVLALDPFVVNLNEEGSQRYLKATFEVELEDEKAQKEAESNKRVVRDDVLRYLSSLQVTDTQGEVGKSKIRGDILARIDKALGGGKVRGVFFTDFVVQ